MRTVLLLLSVLMATLAHAQERPRIRALGVTIGILPTGPLNAITDVAGVRVGQVTLVRGEDVRTGVTAVLPHGGNLFRDKVPGAIFVGNGFGKLAGSTQVEELGEIETPIVLTSTLNVPRVADAVIDFMLALPGNEEVRSINPVVGETNDGTLNDIRSRPVGRDDVFEALRAARGGAVEEGSVGAGTGTSAFGFKGGIGTSSRRLPQSLGGWTVGVLVQTNFGGVLQIAGVPVGQELGQYYMKRELESAGVSSSAPSTRLGMTGSVADGSCMIVIATDAPVDARNLKRIAARGIMGLARTGAAGSNGSGDYAIAFSTSRGGVPLGNDAMSPLFLAAIEATEEAIVNSLTKATTMTGNGHTVEAIPIDRLRAILKKYGR
jgi:D-aminopeptidase